MPSAPVNRPPAATPEEVPSASEMLRDHLRAPDLTTEAVETRLEKSYAETLC
jgi:hypothetical protein